MAEVDISYQLQHDFPQHHIWIDAENQTVCVDDKKNILLLSTDALREMDIFSTVGRHFYQVVVNLIYSRFEILPEKDSYADSLIIRKEAVRDYKIRKLAEMYRMGFLEDGEDILGIDVDDGIPLPLLLEDPDDEDPDDESGNLRYYTYSSRRGEDSEVEELEVIEDEDPEEPA